MAADRELGLIGLGTMGQNLLLNLADHEIPVAGYDRDPEKVARLERSGSPRIIRGFPDLASLIVSLRRPRAVLLLVPAGRPVDDVLDELSTMLSPGDVIIDGGNSHFRDTARRQERLSADGLFLLGMGISGGAEGARHGPSLMPGGDEEAYRHVHHPLELAAAQVDGMACVDLLGKGAAGHHVKMVHNGIEYGLMQLLAECYQILREGLGLELEAVAEIFARWNRGPAGGYLVDITATILGQKDDPGPGMLVDAIVDQAAQKGTGKWTSQDALDLAVPTPVIDAAVAARHLSARRDLRLEAARILNGRPGTRPEAEAEPVIRRLERAWHLAALVAFAEGLNLLQAADRRHGYGLDPARVVRVWRGGCIIRSALLPPLQEALERKSGPPHPLLSSPLAGTVASHLEDLRSVARTGIARGIPLPALTAALAHVEGLRTARLPANLIQAQRDYFGSHGFARLDQTGTFHGPWRDA